ncbi:MAG: hypothetical protein K2Q17_00190 [Nitrospiraceae bacterium]|jgi:hypothetical protein|uniref:hypothetical protein n=1 Tax=Nitrospira cf. moscoviensis SBR1015 TaxID=96242 RepID=UPI000A0CB428|nr:hypothetical protein [Nitrospira cf. moscoviensis SBR1015]MBY0246052.1 hypothetical protein [Nitrospiraceae bacterium]OQW36088.1 MAG: hypothetical protein A4E20_08200 [Nitrospira sp. SG-bin2]
MSDRKDLAVDNAISLNVRLKPSESSAHPHAVNYSNVGVAQGIAYLDFGFIEPVALAAIAKTTKDGQPAPKGLDGHLVTRVAMGVDVLARLQQQIQQVLISLREAQQGKAKG